MYYSICGPLSAAADWGIFVADLLLLIAAASALSCQVAAPSAGGCSSSSCSAARTAPTVVALLLLQILGKTIVCSTILPSHGLELETVPLALANQHLFNQAQPVEHP